VLFTQSEDQMVLSFFLVINKTENLAL
jgi:hypothetical protein